MKRAGLARGWRMTGLVAGGGACLALAACSGASYGDAPYYQPHQQSSLSAAGRQFCQQISATLQALDGGNVTSNMTLAQARGQVDNLMQRGIASFSTLAGEAPRSMRPAILKIVADFRTAERSVDQASSVRQILASVASDSPAQQPSYQQLVSYDAGSC